MRRLLVSLACFLVGIGWFGIAKPVTAQTIPGDMISPVNASTNCISIEGALDALPAIQPNVCRGLAQQYWQIDTDGRWQTGANTSYCLARKSSGSRNLTVRLCTDPLTLRLQVDPTNSAIYTVVGEDLALDNYGSEVGLWSKHGGTNQQWRWFQDDLNLVNTQGCSITYPFAATDTTTYRQELACDRISRLQPPYTVPTAAVRTTMFPGPVAAGLTPVTKNFAFNLQFKDHGYLRMSWAPRNWQSTGLYAPPNQQIRVTVSNATADDLTAVYAQIGVHTDVLQPTSSNVAGSNFLRHPSVVLSIKLVPGENLIRSPYGGPIVLVSQSSRVKTITVEVANAVQAPYFKAGETTEAEWLARRSIGVPYAEIEGELAVLHVPSSEVSDLSFADIQAVSAYYSQMVRYHNELAGLSDDAPLPHQSPQGKQRHVADIQITAGYGHSGFPAMYFNSAQLARPGNSFERSDGWLVWHELGHNYQMGAWSYVYGVETTVNLWSLYAQERFFGDSRLINEERYQEALTILNDPAVTDKWGKSVWSALVFLDQIRIAFPAENWNLWPQLMRRYREMSSSEINALNTDQKKRDKFLEILCELTSTNLTPHWDVWTVPVSDATRSFCATKAALTSQPWTINGARPVYHAGSGTGGFRREWWSGISGTTLTDLTNTPNYPSRPSGTEVLTTTLEAPRNWNDSYGQRLRGYLHPPVTGSYEFWITGDDSVQFWLSSDEDPLNVQKVLELTQATGYRDFNALPARLQRSQPVALVAGRKYYFHVLHKEGGGGDHATVAWTIPASGSRPLEARKLIDPRYLSPYTGDLALSKTIATGQATTIRPGSDITFTLTIANQSSSALRNIEVIDQLPAGFTLSPANVANRWKSGYRYVRIEALSEAGNRGPWTTIAELGVLDATGQAIPKNQWTVHYVNSENPDGLATGAIDDNPATIWHTRWWSNVPSHPHELQIDLGEYYALSGFTYLPRQSGVNGRIGQYRFSVSSNGIDWVQVASGTFPDTSNLQTVSFNAPPVSQAFGLLEGPIAPGASLSVDLIAQASTSLAPGSYTNNAEIVRALDSINSPMYDGNVANDRSSVTFQVALTPVSPQITSVSPSADFNDSPVELTIEGMNFVDGAVVTLGSTALNTDFVDDTLLLVVVPFGQATGSYSVTVTNPNGNEGTLANAYTALDPTTSNYDDLFSSDGFFWVDPLPARVGEEVTLGLFVLRNGGTTTLEDGVLVAFRRDNPITGTSLFTTTTALLEPNGGPASTEEMTHTFTTSGEVTIYAIIDPGNTIAEGDEGNNVYQRTILVEAAATPDVDTTRPTVDGVQINGGDTTTTISRTITLGVEATDPTPAPVSGVRHTHVIEYVYRSGIGSWVPVAQSGWQQFGSSPQSYPWTLASQLGARYLQVRARDGVGNVSPGFVRLLNYTPTAANPDSLLEGQTRLYRYEVPAGQALQVNLDVTSGDADLYVWAPNGTLGGVSYNGGSADDVVTIPAGDIEPGIYQIEVYGYTEATYSGLSVTIGGTPVAAPAKIGSGISQAKTLRTAPLVGVTSSPLPTVGTVPNVAISRVFIPMVAK